MLRFVPIALAIILCFSNLGFIDLGGSTADKNPDTHAPRNHLTQNKSDTSAQAAHVAKLAEIDELYTRWRELQC